MSLIIQWNGGDNITTVGAGAYIGFFSESLGGSIPLDNYQNKTIATNGTGTVNLGELPNVTFKDSTHAVWGETSTSKLLTQIPFNSCTLHIRITSGSNARLQNVQLIAYSGASTLDPPTNMNVKGFEKGQSSWTTMAGSASPLTLTPHISSGSMVHDYYACLSASPTRTGITTAVSLALYAEWY